MVELNHDDGEAPLLILAGIGSGQVVASEADVLVLLAHDLLVEKDLRIIAEYTPGIRHIGRNATEAEYESIAVIDSLDKRRTQQVPGPATELLSEQAELSAKG